MPDKNGEVWAGVLYGRQILRVSYIIDQLALTISPQRIRSQQQFIRPYVND